MREFPDFEPNLDDENTPIMFTGEMVYSWMYDDYKHLQPLKEAAEILAKKKDWGTLYNIEKLAANKVPCAAIIYNDDMYVPVELSQDSASKVGNIRVWITSEYSHSGIHSGGEMILGKLFVMLEEQGYKLDA